MASLGEQGHLQVLNNIQTKSYVKWIEWCPQNPDLVAFLEESGIIQFRIGQFQVLLIHNMHVQSIILDPEICTLQWNPKQVVKL